MGIAKDHHYGDAPWESETKLFAEVAANPKQWLSDGESHLYAAQVLLQPELERISIIENVLEKKLKSAKAPPPLSSQYFLFCALALENSFKAVISAKNCEQVLEESRSKGKLPSFLLGHSLIELAGKAAYGSDDDGEYYLRFLSRYGVWGGKYPLPIHNNDNAVTVKHDDGQHYLAGGFMPKNLSKYLEFSRSVHRWCGKEAKNV